MVLGRVRVPLAAAALVAAARLRAWAPLVAAGRGVKREPPVRVVTHDSAVLSFAADGVPPCTEVMREAFRELLVSLFPVICPPAFSQRATGAGYVRATFALHAHLQTHFHTNKHTHALANTCTHKHSRA